MKIGNRLSVRVMGTDFPKSWTVIDLSWHRMYEPETEEPMIVIIAMLFGVGVSIAYILEENESGITHWNNG